jgi:protein-disulfide isomerase
MHDKMFANQSALERADLDNYAHEIGLNMKRFQADLDGGTWKAAVEQELAEGNKLGATAGPAIFVNGRRLTSAQRFEPLKAKIEDGIAAADALITRGTPAAKIYDELMKDATELAPTEAAAAAAQ